MDTLTRIQLSIMVFIKKWCDKFPNDPVPQQKILKKMKELGIKSYSTLNAINSLINKGYIRKAVKSEKHRTFYVLLRNVIINDEIELEI